MIKNLKSTLLVVQEPNNQTQVIKYQIPDN